MKTVAIIPAFNEATTVRSVIQAVRPFVDNIIVVDDGSSDNTARIAEEEDVILIKHLLNCGLGAALSTGLITARTLGADAAVTIDADGQLFAEDIKRVLKPLADNSADVVIGSRFLNNESTIPLIRRFYNRIGNIVTWALFGVWTTDSQSGIRAFNRVAIKSIQIRCSRMEVSSEFFDEIKKKNIRWQEVPIRVQYTTYSLSKGQNFTHGVRTVARLALRRRHRL